MLANVDGSLDLSGLVRQSVGLMVEQALEAEAAERLGRGYYEHGEPGPNGLSRARRNSYRMCELRSADGTIEYMLPQVRGIESWRSKSRMALAGTTEMQERLAVEKAVSSDKSDSASPTSKKESDKHGRALGASSRLSATNYYQRRRLRCDK